ncbi:unnamed protein product [Closterium sp. NIES-53]
MKAGDDSGEDAGTATRVTRAGCARRPAMAGTAIALRRRGSRTGGSGSPDAERAEAQQHRPSAADSRGASQASSGGACCGAVTWRRGTSRDRHGRGGSGGVGGGDGGLARRGGAGGAPAGG